MDDNQAMQAGAQQQLPPQMAGGAEQGGAAGQMAAQGQGGDTIIAHLTKGEIIIPLNVLTEELSSHIEEAFKKAGVDPLMYVAGSPRQQINPETGQPMFGFFSSLFHAIKSFIAPAVEVGLGALGVPAPLLALGGAAFGAANGGGLKGALLGGLGGYSAGGLGAGISSAGGVGNYLSNTLSGAGQFISHPLDSIGGAVSSAGKAISGFGSGSSASGAGALAGTGGGVSSVAPTGITGGGAGGFSGGSTLASLLSGAANLGTSNTAEDQLLKAQSKSLKAQQPFLASGTAANGKLSDLLGTSGNSGAQGYGSLTQAYTPQDLQNDPGYQFQLNQGNQALTRAAAASGSLDSGATLKAAQDYGQGLAGTTYNNAFNRDLATKQNTYADLSGSSASGQQAANNVGGIYNNIGTAQSLGTVNQGNIATGALSNILTGQGAIPQAAAGRQIIAYDANGKPIYAQG